MKRNETAIESTYGADARAEYVDIADGVDIADTVLILGQLFKIGLA